MKSAFKITVNELNPKGAFRWVPGKVLPPTALPTPMSRRPRAMGITAGSPTTEVVPRPPAPAPGEVVRDRAAGVVNFD